MRKEKILVFVCGGIALSTATFRIFADTAENPYEGIVERNVFNLRPPTPPPPTEPPKAPPPKITLNGITSILGNKRALLQVPGTPAPGKPPATEFFILAEGQRDGDIEILAIDEQAGTVKVNNHGTIQTLDFENNGPKVPAAGPTLPGLLPGRPTMPVNPGQTVLPRIPTRTMRLPPVAPPNARPGQGVPNLPGIIRPRTENELTPEQEAALEEVRLQLQNRGTPKVEVSNKVLSPGQPVPQGNPQEQ